MLLHISVLFYLFTQGTAARIVCYFPNWAGYRSPPFTPANLDPTKCTNAMYAFAILNPTTLTIAPSDTNVDYKYYGEFVSKCKSSPNCKPSLSLGGWADSDGDKYSRMMSSADNRRKFVTTTVDFLQKYKFEGLDIDIEYPSCPQGNCQAGNPADKTNFILLLQELKNAFQPRKWVLSAAIGSYKQVIDRGYDMRGLSENLDWIGVMTYDYHISSPGSTETGPVSPLKTTAGDKYPTQNTVESIKYLIQSGAQPNKLLVGIPFYGYAYKLASSSNNGYWAPTKNQEPPGGYTKNYFEICNLILKENWKSVENDALGAYTFKDDNWISYNSVKDVVNKVKYVKANNFGGVIIWDISSDDFTGSCRSGVNPLLTAIKSNF